MTGDLKDFVVSFKIKKKKTEICCCGQLCTSTNNNGQAEFRWLMLVHANRGQGECSHDQKQKTPLTFFFQPLS